MKHAPIRPTELDSASWPERLEGTWGTAWQQAGLETIRDDARKAGDDDIADAAQYALDTGERDELDWWFAEAEAVEITRARARAYEMATGKDAPDWMVTA